MFQPVVPPEQFAIGRGETRRAEQAEPLRLFGLGPQPRFVVVGQRGRERRRRFDVELGKNGAHGFGVVDAPPVGELRAKNRAAKILTPLIGQSDQRDPCGEHAVLRKRLGPANRRQGKLGANPFQVAPHVAALGRDKG